MPAPEETTVADRCSASASNPTPSRGGDETINFSSTIANAGATVTAHYRTTSSTFTGMTDAAGNGSVTFNIGQATPGEAVPVDVDIGGRARCTTSFTPQ